VLFIGTRFSNSTPQWIRQPKPRDVRAMAACVEDLPAAKTWRRMHQQQKARAGGPALFGNQRIRLAAAGWCHLAVVAEDVEL
jgi:hypothetical protein